MQSLQYFLKNIDGFGVPLTLKLQSKQLLFKSYCGGLLSLIIYSTSLLYFIYVLHQWLNDEIPPKMFSSRVISNFENLNLDDDIISAYNPTGVNDQSIDPFTEQENIITPIICTLYLNRTTTIRSLLNSQQNSIQGLGRIIQIKDGINKLLNTGFISEKRILFIKCNQTYLVGNQSCASEERTQQYFSQGNSILTVQLNKILLDATNQPVKSSMLIYLNLEERFSYSLDMQLRTNIYAISKNLISTHFKEEEHISDSINFGQTNSIEFAQNSFNGLIPYGSIYISLQSDQTQITIQYPQMGELLAQIGSILSILFLLKYMIYSINTSLLQNNLLEEIIAYYYPQFQDVKIQYNVFRQIKSATYKQDKLNLQKFKESYYKLIRKAEMKITFNNILYEQSRLYMALRSIKTQADLRKYHDYGIKMDCVIQNSPNQSYRDINLSYVSSLAFDENDFDLLSLEQRKEQIEVINDEPSISNPVPISNYRFHKSSIDK